MAMALGIDLGTGGLRLALVDGAGEIAAQISGPYPSPFPDPQGWRQGLRALSAELPKKMMAQVVAVAIDGTSGTLLLCRPDGSLLGGALAEALPYGQACPEHSAAPGGASSSAARALALLAKAEAAAARGPFLLRHQADWLMGWLLGDWRWGEAGNNLRLGWDLGQQRWIEAIASQAWASYLPEIRPSGTALGSICPEAARQLGLAREVVVVAGTTDGNASALAAEPGPGDGVAILGTTTVLKQWADGPLTGPGISNHQIGGRWLVGGAANAGAGVLLQFFSPGQIEELSNQIDPRQSTGLKLRPQPGKGERFPVDDPELEPVLGPRPISDAHFLQALLEGLTDLELRGWQTLADLGAPRVDRVLSVGGGARNRQWRQMRSLALGKPVLLKPQASAAAAMGRLALASWQQPSGGMESQCPPAQMSSTPQSPPH
ncbi:sugar kinase [Cyanobium sp. WAJ14-Wanaka]|nr:sugar kinase [Cyanobium sp. WAJ14-Wanaka]